MAKINNKEPRIRVTKKQIIKIKKEKQMRKNTSIYKCKRKIIPGPWTELETELLVKFKLRWSLGINGDNSDSETFGRFRGTYPNLYWWNERGWYPIYINIICPGIKALVEKHGMRDVMIAFEKSINTEDNQKEYGTIVLLEVIVNHALNEERAPEDRFVSCLAKTTKRDIVGFLTTRGGRYRIIRKAKKGVKSNE